MIDIDSLPEFDPSEHLDDDEAIAIFLDEAFKSGNPIHIAHAIGIAAKAKGMTELARKTGIRRENLYQALSQNGNPTLQTLMPVLSALGLTLGVSVSAKHPAA